jgi:hypothetical protein
MIATERCWNVRVRRFTEKGYCHSRSLRSSFLYVLLFCCKESRTYSLCTGKPVRAENMFFLLEYFFSTSHTQRIVNRYCCWNWIPQCSINAQNMQKYGTRLLLLLLLLLLYYRYCMFTCVRLTFHAEHIKCEKKLSRSFKHVRSLVRNFGNFWQLTHLLVSKYTRYQ